MPPYRAPASASSHPPTRVGRYSFSNMQAPRPTFDCFGFGPTPPPGGGGALERRPCRSRAAGRAVGSREEICTFCALDTGAKRGASWSGGRRGKAAPLIASQF